MSNGSSRANDISKEGGCSLNQQGSVTAGASGIWMFTFTTGTDLAVDTSFTLVFVGARDLVDFTCETSLESLFSVEPAEYAGPVSVSRERYMGETAVRFTVTLQKELVSGTSLNFAFGSDDPDVFVAQRYAQTLPVRMLITAGDKQICETGQDVTVEVLPAEFDRWNIVGPSLVSGSADSKISVVPLDAFGNRTESVSQPEISLENRTRKTTIQSGLKPDETGSAPCTLDADGVYEIVVVGPAETRSIGGPIVRERAFADDRLYWGDIHCKTRFSDGAKSVDECFEFARDVACLDFAAVTDHEAPAGYLSDEQWERTIDAVNRFNTTHEFATLLGYEWSGEGEDWFQGHLCVYFRDDTGTLYRTSTPEFCTAAQLMGAVSSRDIIVVPHHPAGPARTHTSEWPVIYNDIEPVAEIFSRWGAYEFHRDALSRKGGRSKAYIRNALRRGHHLGFIAGSNSHYGMPGVSVEETPRDKYIDPRPGLTAVYANELSRGAIFDAIRNRRCYATTGARIVADYSVNGVKAGGTIELERDNPRHIQIEAHGTAPIERVDIIRCGESTISFDYSSPDVAMEWTDDISLPTILMMRPGGYYLFGFYYVRIVQADGHVAWLSPVHIACAAE